MNNDFSFYYYYYHEVVGYGEENGVKFWWIR